MPDIFFFDTDYGYQFQATEAVVHLMKNSFWAVQK